MKVFYPALAATLLLALSAAIAQNAAPIRWAEGAPNATSDVKNDTKIEGLKSDDVHLFVSIADIKDTNYNRVWVQISNHGKAPFEFDPSTTVLVNSDKDKTVRAEIPDKAAHDIEKFGEAKSQELASAHCNSMAATGCQPTNAQMQMSKQVSAYSSQQAAWIRDNGLNKKTLAPGDEEQGVIVFRKDKKAANYILRISVGGQTFEFPLSAQNKQPSYD